MSKEFRPIFAVGNPVKHISSFKDNLETLVEEKRKLEEELSRVRNELEKEKRQKEKLEEEFRRINETLLQKEEELKKISEAMHSERTVESIADNLAEKITAQLRETKESLKNDFVHIAMELLKEFLMTDVVPKEEVITKILEEVFTKVVDLKGTVKIHLNPQDVDRAYEFIGSFSDKLGDRMEVEVIPDNSLGRGEVRIETPRFIIERKNDEILEEIFREVLKRVLEGS